MRRSPQGITSGGKSSVRCRTCHREAARSRELIGAAFGSSQLENGSGIEDMIDDPHSKTLTGPPRAADVHPARGRGGGRRQRTDRKWSCLGILWWNRLQITTSSCEGTPLAASYTDDMAVAHRCFLP